MSFFLQAIPAMNHSKWIYRQNHFDKIDKIEINYILKQAMRAARNFNKSKLFIDGFKSYTVWFLFEPAIWFMKLLSISETGSVCENFEISKLFQLWCFEVNQFIS